MIARIIIAIAAVACIVMTVSAGDRDAPPVTAAIPALQVAEPTRTPEPKGPEPGGTPAPVAAPSATCAADCQTHHDRCRVRTKGSPSCDAERQACLQKCLQKKTR